jgi:Domain of unknown function (DUF4349)
MAVDAKHAALAPSSAPSAAAQPGPGAGAAGGSSTARLVLDAGAAKIRTARMTVAISGYQHVARKADEADEAALAVGGEVDSDDRTNGKHASASLLLRVPPESLQKILSALSELGEEKSRSSSTTDVTERVADVKSRLDSARQSIVRLRALYHSATKVSDVIAVETELSNREADLEALEAQQRSLSKQTALASVSLHLETATTRAMPGSTHRANRGGFLGGLQRGWHGFVATAAWVAAGVGTILPFLLVLLVLVAAVRLLGARFPRGWRRTTPPPVPSD